MYKKKLVRMRRYSRIRHKFKELKVIRLIVHRTPRHIYAQVVAPNSARVLAAASSVEKSISQQLKYTGNKESAAVVGRIIAKRALDKGIKKLSFDRSGFKYHGRIKVLADTARESGLNF